MIWDTSIWRLGCSNHSKIRSAQKCYPCLRYVVSPMSPGRTFEVWRRGWDSNPRYGFPHARFRGECFQPLSHLSAVVADLIVAEQLIFRQLATDPGGQNRAG